MTYAKITFEDGNSFHTGFNGDIADLNAYYLGKYFNFGDTEEHPVDKMVKAVKVELLDDEGELRKDMVILGWELREKHNDEVRLIAEQISWSTAYACDFGRAFSSIYYIMLAGF